MLLKLLLSVVDHGIRLVLKVDDLSPLLVGSLGSLGLLDHAVDVGVGETTAGFDCDRAGLSGGLVLGGDIHDAVCIDVEGHLDLRVTTGSHRDAAELELTKELVVNSHLTLTLEHLDAHLSLVVSRCREHLRLLCWDCGVSVNETGEDTTKGLDTQRQGSNVEKKDVLNLTSENGTLDSGTNSDSLIGVNTLIGLLSEEALHDFLYLGHSSHTTDKQDFINLVLRQARVLEGELARLYGSLNEVINNALQLCSGDLELQVLGARGIS